MTAIAREKQIDSGEINVIDNPPEEAGPMERWVVDVPLTPEERLLILGYGYLFDRIKAAIKQQENN